MVEPSLRTVHIKSMQGEVRTVSLPCDSLIAGLKLKVAEVFPVPPERQRLIFQGKLLKDDAKLTEFVKEDGMTIHMMVKAIEDSQSRPPPPASEPQPSQPGVPSFFSMPFSMFGEAGAGLNPQGILRQVSDMVNQVLPTEMQGFQVNFGGQAPLFQVIQRPGQPAQGPSQPGPIPPDPPSQPIPPMAEERKSQREFALPFQHLHNIGQVINSLTGPQSSFPSPPMPPLPFDRNPLVLMGGFLYMYQFQMLRLLPFMARCGELLQRESLIGEGQQRAELQTLTRAIGTAMHELFLSTQDVYPLFETMEIGRSPSQFILHPPNSAPLTQHDTLVRQVSPQLRPQQSPNPPPQQAPPPPHIPSSPQPPQPPQPPLDAASIANSMSIFALLTATEVDLRPAGALISGLLDSMTLSDLGLLFEGNLQPLTRFPSILSRHVLTAMGGSDSPDGRRRVLAEFLAAIRDNLFYSEFFANRFRPDYDYIARTLSVAEQTGERLLSLLFDHSPTTFPQQFASLLLHNIGSWAEEIVRNVQNGLQTLNQLLESQFAAVLLTSERQAVRNLQTVVLPMAMELVRRAISGRETARQVRSEEAKGQEGLEGGWELLVERDVKEQASAPPQRSFSRAYNSLDAFTRRDPSHISPEHLLSHILTQSLEDNGLELRGAEFTDDLAEAFIGLLESDIIARRTEDGDYDEKRFANMRRITEKRK